MSFEIIVPGRFIDCSDPIPAKVGIEGWFTLEAINRYGQVVRRTSFKEGLPESRIARVGPFHNLLLNQGEDWIGNTAGNSLYAYLSVGIGTTTPAYIDTDLVSQVGSRINYQNIDVRSNSGAPDYYTSLLRTWESAIGAYGTSNLTEIGVGLNAVNSLFSRELIRDNVGNPTTFPILNTEALRAYYELRCYPPTADATYTVNVSGSRDVTVRAYAIASSYWGPSSQNVNTAAGSAPFVSISSNNLVANTNNSIPGGQLANSNVGITMNAYIPGTLKRSGRCSYSTAQANGNGRTHFLSWQMGVFQFQYDPVLVKTSSQTMYLDYEIAWARR